MTKRPELRCLRCGYTWFPRGSNRSRQCPNCKSLIWDLTLGQLALGCLVSLVVLGVLIAVVANLADRGGPPEEKAVAPEQPKEKEPVPKGGKSDDKMPDGVKPPVPPLPVPPTVAERAPPPRRIFNRRPEGFATEWVKRGRIETRVVGVAVRRPVLRDARGDESEAPDRALLVWAETRQLTGGRVDLLRWIGGENGATLIASTGRIEPLRFGDRVLGNQLDRAVTLAPGGPAVPDVLAFPVPTGAKGALLLKLPGQHVGESGSFDHLIPAEVWNP